MPAALHSSTATTAALSGEPGQSTAAYVSIQHHRGCGISSRPVAPSHLLSVRVSTARRMYRVQLSVCIVYSSAYVSCTECIVYSSAYAWPTQLSVCIVYSSAYASCIAQRMYRVQRVSQACLGARRSTTSEQHNQRFMGWFRRHFDRCSGYDADDGLDRGVRNRTEGD